MSNECCKLRGCCNKTQCYMVVAVASNLKSSCRTETFRCSTHGHCTRNERDEMQLDHIGSGCICILVCMISNYWWISCTYTNTFDSTLEPPNLQGRGFLGFSLPMWSLPTEFQRTLTGVRCASRRLATLHPRWMTWRLQTNLRPHANS